jgi:hypothetical protein
MTKPDAINDLTFAELRLASMLLPPDLELSFTKLRFTDMLLPITQNLPPEALAQALAEMVIWLDRLAASRDIDLASAIRERLDPSRASGSP